MIDKIILGLLSKKNLSVYDIKLLMDKSISNFYSNSFGSINPAVKKLEKQGFVNCAEYLENSRLKKVYNITNTGIDAYQDWLKSPVSQGRIKDEALIKVFFLGDLESEVRVRLISDYVEEINDSQEGLRKLKSRIEGNGFNVNENTKFQLATLQFGIDYMKFKQDWFQKFKNSL